MLLPYQKRRFPSSAACPAIYQQLPREMCHLRAIIISFFCSTLLCAHLQGGRRHAPTPDDETELTTYLLLIWLSVFTPVSVLMHPAKIPAVAQSFSSSWSAHISFTIISTRRHKQYPPNEASLVSTTCDGKKKENHDAAGLLSSRPAFRSTRSIERRRTFNASTRFIYCTKKSPIVVRLYIYNNAFIQLSFLQDRKK